MPFQLTITEGKGHGQSFFFDRNEVKIGRLPDNDLVLYDTGVSRYHCEIIAEGGGYTLRDAGSSNGTLLNDVITTEARVSSGDRIGVGPITFTFAEAQGPTVKESKRRQTLSAPHDSGARKALEEDKTVALGDKAAVRALLKVPTEPVSVSVARTATGSFVAYRQQMTGRWRALPNSTRRATLLAVAALVTGLVVSAYIVNSTPPPDRSAEVFPVSADTAILRFGSGKVDVHTPDRASFAFEYHGGRVVLAYAAGSVESAQEVEVLVNDTSVGFVPAAAKWTKGLELVLPRALLKPGRNVITFDNTFTPQRDESWAVSQVNLVQTSLPTPDPVQAKEMFDLAKAAFDTRSVAPHNLFKALEYYDRAALLLEALDDKPDMWASIQEGHKQAERELEQVHMTHLFTAEKAQRFGNSAEAAETLRSLLRYYPNPEDRRHQDVKKRLAQLQEGEP